jgi:hypothetical protein
MGIWTDGDRFFDDHDRDVTSDVVARLDDTYGFRRSHSWFEFNPQTAARRYNRLTSDEPRQRGWPW